MGIVNMFQKSLYQQWLQKEVAPALGCTEPVAIAYAAAFATRYLKAPACKIHGYVSANLYKNAMGVTIPGTKSNGINLAAAIGSIGGNPELGLETLKGITPDMEKRAREMVNDGVVDIAARDTADFIYIDLTVQSAQDKCRVVVSGTHTNVTEVYVNDVKQDAGNNVRTVKEEKELPLFSVADAFNYITSVSPDEISFMLEAARINTRLSDEGKKHQYGLNINQIFKDAQNGGVLGDGLMSQVVIDTVAASDARMGGAPVPAVSNFGSGNQGIAATMPVVVVARYLNVSEEDLIRALAFSHLTAISIHSRYTRLSAFCAASTASMGAAAGMAWLFTRRLDVAGKAIMNMISDITGMVCDGASNSCAMKVATATMSAFKSVLLARQDVCVSPNDGIVTESLESSIDNLCRLVNKPMTYTDKEIIAIMTSKS
ncbi:serine dehydratase subunit alpha family protein [Escherichia coli]|uniref:L-cysteine desulfidase family protein n=2 Tax=Escherichia coli TaxID=562 RepID=UPI00207CF413|nr:L-serine ammonia-lyase, iron-sulfur-dependent, subunit alpha [Escherichia coli]